MSAADVPQQRITRQPAVPHVQVNLHGLLPAISSLRSRQDSSQYFHSWTRHARYFTNCWMSALFPGICGFLADALIHRSHYPGGYAEAPSTAPAAAALSLIVSVTPIGRRIDHLAETFDDPHNP